MSVSFLTAVTKCIPSSLRKGLPGFPSEGTVCHGGRDMEAADPQCWQDSEGWGTVLLPQSHGTGAELLCHAAV